MAGLSTAGLEIKRLSDVLDGLRNRAGELFSDLVPEGDLLDVGNSSTLGRLIGLVSPSEADLWEALQQVYSSFDPNSAEGIALDNLVILAGIERLQAQASTARVLFQGDYAVTIPVNSLISSSFTNKRFSIPTEIDLDENQTAGIIIGVQSIDNLTPYDLTASIDGYDVMFTFTSDADATENEILTNLASEINTNAGAFMTATVVANTLEIINTDLIQQITWTKSSNLYYIGSYKLLTTVCTETGPNEQPTGTINRIDTPVFGWNSISQIEPSVTGSNVETDSELRARFNDTKFTRGSNLLESLYSNLVSLSGVDKVVIYENYTDSVDAKSIPAHAFMVLIQGGIEAEIAEIIWNNKPAGIATHGNTAVNILDIQGQTKSINLQRPTYTDLYVEVTVTTDADFPPDGADRIKTALADYINNGFSIGQSVIYSRLYTPINAIPGHSIDSLYIDVTASPTATANITIDFDKIAKLELGNIEVIET